MEQGVGSDEPEGPRGSTWPLITLVVLAAATLLVLQMRRQQPFDSIRGLTLPPLDSAGWLNSERSLTTADLRGKIVVIDFFASWCGPCNAAMPDLVEFHQRYRDRGVMLVGLTSEPASELERIQQFDQRVEGVDWPIAYGARLAFEVTGIEGVPTYVLYDRTGKAVWSGASIDELERATVELLAME